ncbi:class I SAM-dependent methyltransferase [Candidatus Thioglobus sp.]|nr:class I SAM-dependent methyltransferase [Candidatus Thioglobus sp.]MDC1165325.1 class I SAM-dependent methyltransferase [Candidatus Thioglobus sp.]
MSNITWNKVNSFKENRGSEALSHFRPCPICGSIDSKTVLGMDDFQFYSDSGYEPKLFNVRESICLSCFAVYLNPCYSEYGFNVLFSEAGQSYGSAQEHTNEQIAWLKDNELLDDGICLLDVGCYDGSFLSQLPDNVKKIGVDIDESAIERGRQKNKKADIEFFSGDFETFLYNGPEPDTITMYHVLEHLPRPVEVLKKLRSISKPSTKIVVEVPIIENGNTNDINGFFSIQHTTHFSAKSLFNCFVLAGWKIEKKYTTSDYNGYRVVASPQLNVDYNIELKREKEDWTKLNSSLLSWYEAISTVEKIIQNIPECNRFVIWGGGAHTEYLYQTTSFFHIHHQSEFIIVDADPVKHGKTWRGILIHEPSIIKELDWSSTNLLISSYGGQESIIEEANKFGITNANIVKLYKTIRRY